MSYSTKLNQLAKSGHSPEYIESVLWKSFSRHHSLQKIAKDVDAALANHS